jgi:hypothetical protein
VEVKLMITKLLIVVFALSLSVNAFAQQISSNDYKTTTVYITATDINVRETPPEKGLILIGGPGKVVFELKKDTPVIVVEKKVIESVFSKTIWVKIRVLYSKGQNEGWIYWGDDEEKSVNLTLKGVK